MLVFVSWGSSELKVIFYLHLTLRGISHSTDVQKDRFSMQRNTSSSGLYLLPGHLMQGNESVADTLR